MPRLPAFLAVAIVLVVTPGPDMVLVARYAVLNGRRTAIAAAFGVIAGITVHAAAAAVGLSAIIASSATVFTVLKIAGAVYLVGIGLRALYEARRSGDAPDEALREPARAGQAFRQGFICNALNPKVALFFLTFIPQFIDRDGAVLPQIVLLAVLFQALGIVWLVAYAVMVARLAGMFRRARVRRTLQAVSGTVLVALGARLAVAEP